MTLNVKYHNSAFQDRPTMTGGLHIECMATSMASVIYFDDFKLMCLK